ncbi:hypothetical protein [Vibrio anguillarum]|uniref:hypothetical protein n=5 Tax=Vibrio anguillarum TaxID=55601 RepID=UPI000BB4F5B6|nr:hypothetical protein [Vibrio anguillarum]ATC60179.1 hypothetical protein CMV05_22580 [Vibrio anguillarum]MBF4250661.1 hypothetical protein [Vibrio anguillarum]NCO45417.1 hypothetical protein [Vibrio sp.]
MKLTSIATSISLTLLLAACTSYQEIEETQSKVEDQINKDSHLIDKLKNEKPLYAHVTIRDTLFVPPVSKQEARKPDWWFKSITGGRGIDMPLSDAIRPVVGDSVNISYGRNIDRNKKIAFSGDTIGEVIDSIAAASGYSYRLISENKLTWSMYDTRTFKIATGPGKDYFGQGKGQGESNSEDATINAKSEYVNASGEIDPLNEVYQELLTYSSFRKAVSKTTSSFQDLPPLSGDEDAKKEESIATDEIPIYLNRATSTITVRDTPAVLDEMAKIVTERNNLFRTNVYLEIDIIEVKLTNEGQQALDISTVIQDLGSVALKTGIAAGTGAAQIGRATTSLPTNIIGLEITKGKAKGSTMLMEALSAYGAVSSRTMPRQTLQPNTAAKLADFENVYFIEERAANTTANVGTELSIKQDNLDVGFSLYVMPTIFDNDVTIRMATNISSLIELTRNGDTTTGDNGDKESTSTYVESPRTSKKDFFSKFTVPAGDTIVLSGLSREIKSLRRGKGMTELLAQSEFGKSEKIETIITVTPYINRPRS